MKYWIARDKTTFLYLYTHEPKLGDDGIFESSGDYYDINSDLFPEITFENSPQRVEIKLIE